MQEIPEPQISGGWEMFGRASTACLAFPAPAPGRRCLGEARSELRSALTGLRTTLAVTPHPGAICCSPGKPRAERGGSGPVGTGECCSSPPWQAKQRRTAPGSRSAQRGEPPGSFPFLQRENSRPDPPQTSGAWFRSSGAVTSGRAGSAAPGTRVRRRACSTT